MVSAETIGTIFLKVFKLILNFVVILVYRTGYGGDFLGVGGTWNLNEEKSPDAEIVASGVMVGFFIYTSVQLITFMFGTTKHKRELSEFLMSSVYCVLWTAVGGVALHYWHGYLNDYDFIHVASERVMGLMMGSLCIVIAALNLVDAVLAFIHFAKYENNK